MDERTPLADRAESLLITNRATWLTTERQYIMQTEYFLTAEQFRAIANLAHCASTDDVTPVIQGVYVTIESGTLTAVATDRYRVGRVKFPVQTDNTGEDSINIKGKDLLAHWRKFKDLPVTFVIEHVEDLPAKYRIECQGAIVTDFEIGGNYPPVEKLIPTDFDTWTGTPMVSLKPAFLGTLGKLYHPSDSRREKIADNPWKFYFQADESGRSKPVYATRGYRNDHEQGTVLDYLVQPNLILER